MALSAGSSALRGAALVVFGGVVLSLGIFTIREARTSEAVQYIFWRGVGFSLAMLAVATLSGRLNPARQLAQLSWFGIAGAVSLATSAAAFITAVRVSTVAETFLILSLAPLAAAALAWPLLGERAGPWTIAAILLSVAGVYVMIGGQLEGGNWLGRTLGAVACVTFAGYMLSTRGARRDELDAMLLAYGLVSIVGAAVALQVRGTPLLPPKPGEIVYAMAHGAIVLSAGLWLFGRGSRHLSAVALTMLAQTESLAAPVIAFLFYDEVPSRGVLLGGAAVLAALVMQSLDGSPEPARDRTAERRP